MNKDAVKKLEESLFTTSKPDEKTHRCVIVFDKKHAATYRHGSHSSLKLNEKVTLYSVTKENTKIEVVVSCISDMHDFVVFEAIEEFPHHPHRSDVMYCGQYYRQLGVSETREPIWKDGMVSEMFSNHFIGTTHGWYGDSGSGIFALNGSFIGISVAKKRSAISTLPITSGAAIDLEEVADHTKLLSATAIYYDLKIDDGGNYVHADARSPLFSTEGIDLYEPTEKKRAV